MRACSTLLSCPPRWLVHALAPSLCVTEQKGDHQYGCMGHDVCQAGRSMSSAQVLLQAATPCGIYHTYPLRSCPGKHDPTPSSPPRPAQVMTMSNHVNSPCCVVPALGNQYTPPVHKHGWHLILYWASEHRGCLAGVEHLCKGKGREGEQVVRIMHSCPCLSTTEPCCACCYSSACWSVLCIHASCDCKPRQQPLCFCMTADCTAQPHTPAGCVLCWVHRRALCKTSGTQGQLQGCASLRMTVRLRATGSHQTGSHG
jgi:hypothetical protein